MEQAARSGVLDQVVAVAALVAAEGALGLGVEDAVADVEAAAEQRRSGCVLGEGDVVEAHRGLALVAIGWLPAHMLDRRAHTLGVVAVEGAVADVAGRAVAVHVQGTGVALFGAVGDEAGFFDVDDARRRDGGAGVCGIAEAQADARTAGRAAIGDVVGEGGVAHVDGVRCIRPQRGAAAAVGRAVVAHHRAAHRERGATGGGVEVAGERGAVGVDRAAVAELVGIREAGRRIDGLVADKFGIDDGQTAELRVERAAQP